VISLYIKVIMNNLLAPCVQLLPICTLNLSTEIKGRASKRSQNSFRGALAHPRFRASANILSHHHRLALFRSPGTTDIFQMIHHTQLQPD
jgi:hypothetical protein